MNPDMQVSVLGSVYFEMCLTLFLMRGHTKYFFQTRSRIGLLILFKWNNDSVGLSFLCEGLL